MPRLRRDARDQGLGARLRFCRIKARMNQSQVCEHLDWDKSALSRLEGGLRQISLADVAQLVGLYGVHGELRKDLLSAARNQDSDLWWEFAAPSVDNAAMLAEYESTATAMTDWAPMLIPGMLQTREFAEAWLANAGAGTEEIGTAWKRRRDRQKILNSDLRYTAYIGEAALRIMVGNPAVMAGQLAALQRSRQHNISVRTVPAHVSTADGQLASFVMLEFAEIQPIVMVELPQTSLFQDRPQHTAPYLDILKRLDTVARGEKESAELMQRVQARWSEIERQEVLA